MRPQGSPAELERRRLRAIDLLQRDIPVHVVAERLGVDRRSVRARFPRLDPDRSERQGRCIRASTTLALWHEQASLDKKRQISTCYLRRYICGGAIHRRRDREACRRIVDLIRHSFKVVYHPDHVGRLLRACGFSPQRPQPRAKERDDRRVREWIQRDWPRVKKTRAPRRPSDLPR